MRLPENGYDYLFDSSGKKPGDSFVKGAEKGDGSVLCLVGLVYRDQYGFFVKGEGVGQFSRLFIH